MYPILFKIGPFPFYAFGAVMALGAYVVGILLWIELKRHQYNPFLLVPIVVALALGGFIGARLLFILLNWDDLRGTSSNLFLSEAGFTWYGGLLGGMLTVGWMVHTRGIPWLRIADVLAPALAVAYAMGRLACFLAGDGDWGLVSDLPWAMAFPNAIIGWSYPPGVKVHPTQIYEILFSLIFFAVLWAQRKKSFPEGLYFWGYLGFSGLSRLAVEFWRPGKLIAFGLNQAQWLSLCALFLASWQVIRLLCRERSKFKGSQSV